MLSYKGVWHGLSHGVEHVDLGGLDLSAYDLSGRELIGCRFTGRCLFGCIVLFVVFF